MDFGIKYNILRCLARAGFEVVDLGERAPWCPSCAEDRYDYATADRPSSSLLCGREAVQLRGGTGPALDLPALAAARRKAMLVKDADHRFSDGPCLRLIEEAVEDVLSAAAG